MKKIIAITAVAAAAALLASCTKNELPDGRTDTALLTARVDASAVKTVLDGTSVLWDASDSISVFYSGNSKFKIKSMSADRKTAVFEGPDEENPNAGLYPYTKTASYASGTISGVVIPSEQTAAALSFANESNPAVATVDGSGDLAFKNIGTLVSFTVAEDGIDWVTVEADVDIAGTADVTVADEPVVTFTSGVKTVKLSGTFENGGTYYAVVAPCTIGSLKFTFHKAAQGAEVTATAKTAKTLVRNGNYSLGTIASSGKWVNGIWDDGDLIAFGEAVTAGEDISAYKDGEGVVNMWRDVDLGNNIITHSIIGHVRWGVVSNIYNVNDNESKVFKGTFDGQNHSVRGMSISISSLGNMMPAGLFGVVKDATIRNLNVSGTGVYAVATSTKVAIGSIAGLAINSTIENCTSDCTRIKARMKTSPSASTPNQRMGLGGIVGIINDVTIKDCTNNSRVGIINGAADGTQYNTNNGADGGQLGGICGFASGTSNTITVCTNNGQAGGYESDGTNIGGACRTGGIVATILKNTTVKGCINNGRVECTDTVSSDKSSRTAGITAYMDGTASELDNCENNGMVCFSPANTESVHYYGYCGGMAGQFAKSVKISGCRNYGDVLSDNFTESDANYNATGIIIARPNTQAATISDCTVGGRIGGYTDPSTIVPLSSANYEKYISGDTAARRAKLVISGCKYGTK